MIKLPHADINNFLENYSGKISSEVMSEIKKGTRLFIFNGPSGTGKSFLAECIANNISASIDKINVYTLEDTDDLRISDSVLKRIENAATSISLTSQSKKLLYIEDAEKVLRLDPSIFKKLEKLNQAVIIFESESGEIFRAKNKKFLSNYKIIRFYKLKDNVLMSFMRATASLNKINLTFDVMSKLVENANGNISSLISDIQTFVLTGRSIFNKRSSAGSIFEQISSILSGKDIWRDFYLSSDNDAKLFEIWLADKIYPSFKGKILSEAFERISFADLLIRKIHAQNWGLLKYIKTELTTSISSVSENKKPEISYTPPDWKQYYGY